MDIERLISYKEKLADGNGRDERLDIYEDDIIVTDYEEYYWCIKVQYYPC